MSRFFSILCLLASLKLASSAASGPAVFEATVIPITIAPNLTPPSITNRFWLSMSRLPQPPWRPSPFCLLVNSLGERITNVLVDWHSPETLPSTNAALHLVSSLLGRRSGDTFRFVAWSELGPAGPPDVAATISLASGKTGRWYIWGEASGYSALSDGTTNWWFNRFSYDDDWVIRRIPALVTRLADPHETARGEVIYELGRYGSNALQALPQLLLAVNDPDQKIRAITVATIARATQDATLIGPTLLPLSNDPDPTVRTAAIRALAASRPLGQAASVAILGALHDADPSVRREAASACWEVTRQTHSAAALTPLINTLDDHDPTVRTAAARGLLAMGRLAADALPKLRLLLSDGDPEVHRAVSSAIRRIAASVENPSLP